jgi:aspartyl-tRNA(Asn)/glutamyl-tRNA(Gln) amidotransferase subunit B
MRELETVIGLEVHLQMSTATKAFCGCSTIFGAEPNSHTCPVCLGFPGSLPVLNERYLEYAMRVALALNCKIQALVKFDRKNYYYPDLPKNYQISQYDLPLSANGFVEIKTESGIKRIRIKRVHMEEDAGKLIHETNDDTSWVDFNRSGMPLLEIVSEPDIASPEEAQEYLSTLKLILKYLNVSDCDMEKGSLRCDANISLREKGCQELGVKAEVKNMNSFKAVRAALQFEVDRQTEQLSKGEKIIQETRLWNAEKEVTISMRSKEEAHDYRYFPEPDLVPFIIVEEKIVEAKASLPELPQARQERFVKDYQLSASDSFALMQDKELADYFEQCVKVYHNPKQICNWLIGPVAAELNSRKVNLSQLGVSALGLAILVDNSAKGIISNLVAKEVLTKMIDSKKSASQIIKDEGLAQVSSVDDLSGFVEEAVKENQKSVDDFKAGKENALMFLIGQVMKKSKGKANPKMVGEILRSRLK